MRPSFFIRLAVAGSLLGMILPACAPARPDVRTAANLTTIARQLLDQGQKQTALAILQNAQTLDPQSKEIPPLIARAKTNKESSPPRWVTFPHQQVIQGVEIVANSAYVNAAAEGWSQSLPVTLEKDEIWFVVEGNAYAREGGSRRSLPWRPFLRVMTRLGQSIAPEDYLRSGSAAAAGGKAQLAPGERVGVRFFFRLHKSDFPVQLKFSDGAMIDFATLSAPTAPS